LKRGYALFGLYEGNEQTGKRKKTVAPDKISVFRRAIMEQFVRPSKVRQQIFKTVWHEIAHHFGADETKAEKAELRMFEKYVRQQGLCGAQKRQVRKKMKIRTGRNGYKRKSKITYRVSRAS